MPESGKEELRMCPTCGNVAEIHYTDEDGTYWSPHDPLAELREKVKQRILTQDMGEEGYRKRGELTHEIQARYETGRSCYDWFLSLIDSLQNEQKGNEDANNK